MQKDDGCMQLWTNEVHKDVVQVGFRVDETLFSKRSRFQQIDVVQTRGHGRMLLNDGVGMLTERDEFIYHEMIAHVPLCVHPDPARVLIIGGGDCGSAREILRHPAVRRLVLVEIDEVVIEACRAHFPWVAPTLKDPRLELRIEDGLDYIERTTDRFDIAIVDSTDPVGPAVALYGKPFYEKIARLLKAPAIMITQAESPFYDLDLIQPMLQNQRPFFERLHLYLYPSLTFPGGGLWAFGFASHGLCPLSDFDPGKLADARIETRYYSPGIHRAAFMLPVCIREALGAFLDPQPD